MKFMVTVIAVVFSILWLRLGISIIGVVLYLFGI
jgi:hypothetical protein